jgi:hypothetical protein
MWGVRPSNNLRGVIIALEDNSKERLHDIFFYGLYMVPEILEQKGVVPRNPRKGTVEGFELRIGNKATLLRATGKTSYGMVYSLNHDEIYSLYQGSGLTEYAPEAIAVNIEKGVIPALCCNLIDPPNERESNQEYESKLKAAMKELGLPWN